MAQVNLQFAFFNLHFSILNAFFSKDRDRVV